MTEQRNFSLDWLWITFDILLPVEMSTEQFLFIRNFLNWNIIETFNRSHSDCQRKLSHSSEWGKSVTSWVTRSFCRISRKLFPSQVSSASTKLQVTLIVQQQRSGERSRLCLCVAHKKDVASHSTQHANTQAIRFEALTDCLMVFPFIWFLIQTTASCWMLFLRLSRRNRRK